MIIDLLSSEISFRELPNIRKLIESLWIQYFFNCELFDRRVCTGTFPDGDAMPCGPNEYAAIQINAREEYSKLSYFCQFFNIPPHEIKLAKDRIVSLTFEQLQHEYSELAQSNIISWSSLIMPLPTCQISEDRLSKTNVGGKSGIGRSFCCHSKGS